MLQSVKHILLENLERFSKNIIPHQLDMHQKAESKWPS